MPHTLLWWFLIALVVSFAFALGSWLFGIFRAPGRVAEGRGTALFILLGVLIVLVAFLSGWRPRLVHGNPITSGTCTVGIVAEDGRRSYVQIGGAALALGNGGDAAVVGADSLEHWVDQGLAVRRDQPRLFGGCAGDTVWMLPRPITMSEGWLEIPCYFAAADTDSGRVYRAGSFAAFPFGASGVTYTVAWDTSSAAVGRPARVTSLSAVGADRFGAFWVWTVAASDSDAVLGPGRWFTLTFSRDPPPAGSSFLDPDPTSSPGNYASGSITPCPPDSVCP